MKMPSHLRRKHGLPHLMVRIKDRDRDRDRVRVRVNSRKYALPHLIEP